MEGQNLGHVDPWNTICRSTKCQHVSEEERDTGLSRLDGKIGSLLRWLLETEQDRDHHH